MNEFTLTVRLDERSHDILVTNNSLPGIGGFARTRAKGDSAFIIADENALSHARSVHQSLQKAGFRTALAVRPPGEAQKSLEVAGELYDELIEFSADRRTLVVAVGGGVIGDLAGFVAATFARGIPLLMVPTTLLAMVDSSVGGKVGINRQRIKNMVGAFHQPIGVYIDIGTLGTLPEREFRSGLAEVVKYGVSLDADFYQYLEQNTAAILGRDPAVIPRIVARCCELKAAIVEQDEREATGVRAKLNYGHTFAHAFETAGGDAPWLHGEAVAAGMMCASVLAENRGLAPKDLSERQRRLLRTFSLPTAPLGWPLDLLLAAMRKDKKALGGTMRFVLPTRLGEVAVFDDIQESEVRDVLTSLTPEDEV